MSKGFYRLPAALLLGTGWNQGQAITKVKTNAVFYYFVILIKKG